MLDKMNDDSYISLVNIILDKTINDLMKLEDKKKKTTKMKNILQC